MFPFSFSLQSPFQRHLVSRPTRRFGWASSEILGMLETEDAIHFEDDPASLNAQHRISRCEVLHAAQSAVNDWHRRRWPPTLYPSGSVESASLEASKLSGKSGSSNSLRTIRQPCLQLLSAAGIHSSHSSK